VIAFSSSGGLTFMVASPATVEQRWRCRPHALRPCAHGACFEKLRGLTFLNGLSVRRKSGPAECLSGNNRVPRRPIEVHRLS
jgi:hypothetical protein